MDGESINYLTSTLPNKYPDVFERAVSGKGKKKNADGEYKPKRKDPELSEEEEDDFDQDELDKPTTPEVSFWIIQRLISPHPLFRRELRSVKFWSSVTAQCVLSADKYISFTPGPQATAPPKKKKKAAPAAPPKVTVIEIDDESDNEAETHTKRGPKNASRDHFHPPIPVKHGGKKCWEFKCKHCTTSLTVERTITKDQSYDDEPAPQPSLCNLATHLKKHGGPNIPVPGAAVPGETRGISTASARIMDEFLRDGQLNPAKVRTQRGFLKVFTAWLVEDDLPFTTGETGGIQRLVRNTLARIYTEMFDKLKADLKAIDKWLIEREELRPLLLSNSQWKILEELGKILQLFTQVTLQMSKSSTPTLPWVLPMYRKMAEHLTTTRDNENVLQSLRVAAGAGLEKLQMYYTKALGCQFNVIATGG
ncbi:hypothetical protein DFH07DRAFT_760491 [Mycena maculata]|uniref:Uncharacterized protein n=1 Tax=Mycena maculata TaxID=230809 RepID=A0AAD7MKU0_9AGAR|nr:hypothetical protein DFH07DRAFT_760491 [Mycena maculata]